MVVRTEPLLLCDSCVARAGLIAVPLVHFTDFTKRGPCVVCRFTEICTDVLKLDPSTRHLAIAYMGVVVWIDPETSRARWCYNHEYRPATVKLRGVSVLELVRRDIARAIARNTDRRVLGEDTVDAFGLAAASILDVARKSPGKCYTAVTWRGSSPAPLRRGTPLPIFTEEPMTDEASRPMTLREILDHTLGGADADPSHPARAELAKLETGRAQAFRDVLATCIDPDHVMTREDVPEEHQARDPGPDSEAAWLHAYGRCGEDVRQSVQTWLDEEPHQAPNDPRHLVERIHEELLPHPGPRFNWKSPRAGDVLLDALAELNRRRPLIEPTETRPPSAQLDAPATVERVPIPVPPTGLLIQLVPVPRDVNKQWLAEVETWEGHGCQRHAGISPGQALAGACDALLQGDDVGEDVKRALRSIRPGAGPNTKQELERGADARNTLDRVAATLSDDESPTGFDGDADDLVAHVRKLRKLADGVGELSDVAAYWIDPRAFLVDAAGRLWHKSRSDGGTMPWAVLTGLGDEATGHYPIWERRRSDPPEGPTRALYDATRGWFEKDGETVTYEGKAIGDIIADLFRRHQADDVMLAVERHEPKRFRFPFSDPVAALRIVLAVNGYTAVELHGGEPAWRTRFPSSGYFDNRHNVKRLLRIEHADREDRAVITAPVPPAWFPGGTVWPFATRRDRAQARIATILGTVRGQVARIDVDDDGLVSVVMK